MRRPSAPLLMMMLLMICLAGRCHAHLLNMSNVTVALQHDGTLKVTLMLDLLVEAGSREAYYELSVLPAPLSDSRVKSLMRRLNDAIALEADGRRVSLRLEKLAFAQQSRDDYLSPLAWPRAEVTFLAESDAHLNDAAQLRVRFLGGFVLEEPIATTFIIDDTGRSMTRWLVSEQYSPQFATTGWQGTNTAATVPKGPSLPTVFMDYLELGFVHILPMGADHLLFVLGLCIGSSTFRRLVALITLFTLAHTLSLGAVSVGLVPASPRIVEPLILLTILWVAIENLRPTRRFNVRVILVLAFGLIHGMGFAGALKTIGLPADAFFTALFGFNLGVEFAQIIFITGILLMLQSLRRWEWYSEVVVRNGSLAIAGVSLFWVAQMLR